MHSASKRTEQEGNSVKEGNRCGDGEQHFSFHTAIPVAPLAV